MSSVRIRPPALYIHQMVIPLPTIFHSCHILADKQEHSCLKAAVLTQHYMAGRAKIGQNLNKNPLAPYLQTVSEMGNLAYVARVSFLLYYCYKVAPIRTSREVRNGGSRDATTESGRSPSRHQKEPATGLGSILSCYAKQPALAAPGPCRCAAGTRG